MKSIPVLISIQCTFLLSSEYLSVKAEKQTVHEYTKYLKKNLISGTFPACAYQLKCIEWRLLYMKLNTGNELAIPVVDIARLPDGNFCMP
jgi:hypothetical protein